MSVVFSLDKGKVRQSFTLAADSYDGLAMLQRRVGLDLIDTFYLKGFTDNSILDIGCGTGFLTQALTLNSSIPQIIAVDIALSMLQISRIKLKPVEVIQFVCADAEQLPLQKKSVDKIVSNLALQWCQNLTTVFDGFSRVLKQQGQVYFSTLGPATLQELKNAWSKVDDYSHVNEFYSTDELLAFLQQAGFKNIQIKSKRYQSNYQTVIDLMRELKGLGAHHVSPGRNKKTTRKEHLRQMIETYEKHRCKGLIPATYEIIFISAQT